MMKLNPTEKVETVNLSVSIPKQLSETLTAFCQHFNCDRASALNQILTKAMKGFDPNGVDKTPRTAPKNGKNGAA